MKTYPKSYNPVLEYWQYICENPDKVNRKIKLQIKKIVSDITDQTSGVYYDNQKANHVFEFFENYLRNIKGKDAGKLIELQLFQKAILGSAFGIIYKKNGLRRTKRVVLIIAKKNGKSVLQAGTGLYMQFADGEGGPECFSVATKKDQAKIVWKVAKRMVNHERELRKSSRSLVGEIITDYNDGEFRPLASDGDTLDGLDIHFVSMDEFHQWKNGYDLYDILYKGMDNRQQPLAMLSSTAGTLREDIYDILYDEAELILNNYESNGDFADEQSLFFIYELDEKDEWKDFDKLIKANPGIGTIRNKESLRKEWEKTKRNQSMYLKSFLTKNCNIRETAFESALTFEELNNTATFNIEKLKPNYVVAGIDMSSTTDLTCVTFLFMVRDDPTIYADQMYFIPEDVAQQKIETDKIPYDRFRDRGIIVWVPGNKIDVELIWEWISNYTAIKDFVVYWAGFDSWGADILMKRFRENFGKKCVEEVRQVFKVLSNPLKELLADIKAKRINYNNNPLTKWCMGNLTLQQDNKGNIQPKKGKHRYKRIDGMASLLDAYIVFKNHEDDYKNLI